MARVNWVGLVRTVYCVLQGLPVYGRLREDNPRFFLPSLARAAGLRLSRQVRRTRNIPIILL